MNSITIGSKNNNFDYHTIKSGFQDCINDNNIAELNIANNGFRREIYQAPGDSHGGSDFSYCEGDLSLVVPKNKDDFMVNLDSDIKFYLEDEYSVISDEKFNEIKSEMINKLGCDIPSPSIDECIEQIEKEEAAKVSVKVGMK